MTTYHPQRTANEITVVLRRAGVADFPINVRSVALEISKAKYPNDPVAFVKGDVLPGFEGALSPAPSGKKGWGIIYNSDVASKGRVNFTLAHEFGHYLLHRKAYPRGFKCSIEDMATWESEYAQRENEANSFAATLLMPLDDFRTQIDSSYQPNYDELGACADRYGVSLIASILRWLQYTSRRSMFVVSRDGFILWARSSKKALRTGLYFRTRNNPPIPVPDKSLAAKVNSMTRSVDSCSFEEGIWLSQPSTEQVMHSEQYDFTLSLVHFHDVPLRSELLEKSIEDLSERVRKGFEI